MREWDVRTFAWGLGALLVLGHGPTAAQTAFDANQSRRPFRLPTWFPGSHDRVACDALGNRAVWVVIDNQGECIRYYLAEWGAGTQALVYLHDDVVTVNGRGEANPQESYLRPSRLRACRTGAPAGPDNCVCHICFLGGPGSLARPGTTPNAGRRRSNSFPRRWTQSRCGITSNACT